MDFNQLVIEKIFPLFQKQDFTVENEYNNFFQFKSAHIEVIISYNELDRTSLFEVGKRDNFLYPINDKAINIVFGSDIKVDKQTKEVFIDNIAIFLESEGSIIFKGDTKKLDEFKHFIEAESNIYTSQILKQQNLSAADKAWNVGNYMEFIKLIEQVNKNNVPFSYLLKYKIAIKRV